MLSYIEELNNRISQDIDKSRYPVDEITFCLIDQYGFNFSHTDLDSYKFPICGFVYESKIEIQSTPEFLKEIKTLNRKARDLGMEVYFRWVEIFGVNGKYGMQYDVFMTLYGGKRYLNKGRFKRITIEIRVIYPD